MGILIIPIQLGAAMMVLICLLRLLRWLVVKDLSIRAVLFGTLVSVVLYGGVLVSYYLKGEVYVLDPYFRFTVSLFYAPFVFGIFFSKADRKTTIMIRKVVFSSIVISGLAAICFYDLFFNVNTFLNLPSYH